MIDNERVKVWVVHFNIEGKTSYPGYAYINESDAKAACGDINEHIPMNVEIEANYIETEIVGWKGKSDH